MESENNHMEPPPQETVDVANSETDEDLDEDETVHVAVVHHEENATNTTNEDSSGHHSWEKIIFFRILGSKFSKFPGLLLRFHNFPTNLPNIFLSSKCSQFFPNCVGHRERDEIIHRLKLPPEIDIFIEDLEWVRVQNIRFRPKLQTVWKVKFWGSWSKSLRIWAGLTLASNPGWEAEFPKWVMSIVHPGMKPPLLCQDVVFASLTTSRPTGRSLYCHLIFQR